MFPGKKKSGSRDPDLLKLLSQIIIWTLFNIISQAYQAQQMQIIKFYRLPWKLRL